MNETGTKINSKALDLSNLKTYTIDDNSADEVDDAISLEKYNNKLYIWIHIVDPTSLIQKDSSIDKLCMANANSLYLIKNTINMIPINKSYDYRGFKQNVKTNCLSTRILLNEKGNIVNSEVLQTIICPNYSISYEDADELIELEPREEKDLSELYKLMQLRLRARKENGAVKINQIQGIFTESITDPKLIFREKSPSRILIEELMILMGTVIASYTLENNIPMIYRAQEHSLLPNQENYKGKYNYESFIKSRLKKAYYTCSVSPHYSLGLKSYVHVTSPLRRYIDLIVHRQIINYLNNRQLYSKFQLSEIMSRVSTKMEENTQIYRQEQLNCCNSWLKNNRKLKLNAISIRAINQLDNLFLIRLIDIEKDIICQLLTKEIINCCQELIITFKDIENKTDVPIFSIVKK